MKEHSQLLAFHDLDFPANGIEPTAYERSTERAEIKQ